jgi:hypothetical protein
LLSFLTSGVHEIEMGEMREISRTCHGYATCMERGSCVRTYLAEKRTAMI